MHSLTQVSQSTTPIVSLADAKTHLRVDYTTDDTYIAALVERATELIEYESNTDLRTTTWNWVGHFPHPRWHTGFYSPYHHQDFVDGYMRSFRHRIILPRAPLVSVDSVTFFDVDNELTNWTNTDGTVNYYVMTPNKCLGWIQPALFWPATFDSFRPDAATIHFTSGYAVAPPLAVHACLLAVGSWYEERANDTELRLGTLGLGFQRCLDQLSIDGVVG